MESLEKQLGNRIKSLRKLRGWTQENLAEQAKVSVQHVGEIERGDGNPTLQSLERLSQGFGVTVSQLLAVEEPDQEAELIRGQVIETVQEMPAVELKLLQGVINLAKRLSLRVK
ncbi:helix-turn-helix domain-containing protein [Solidesulfovibrio alcoholivorans]|uniref:helix-turn-helix domain-containing protein n=1 Tax=Solidesulfovibrio alcoholivorans TaxID=81406 RepID=UPI000A053EA6|nr:helix-turn-helix transcriptional regulator [Solidesulfovibrio alcoholivorans]